MTTMRGLGRGRAVGIGLCVLVLAGSVSAQENKSAVTTNDAAPTPAPVPPPPPSATTDAPAVPPPPPADAPSATQVPEPPASYGGQAQASATVSVGASPASSNGALPPRPPVVVDRNARKLFSAWLGLGYGDAIGCGNEDPESPCAVEGAVTFVLGIDYRFHPLFSVGLELGLWGFAVSDAWRGDLRGEPDDAQIGAGYLGIFGRWYWFDKGIVDPYLHFGLGVGSMTAKANNEVDTFEYVVAGVVPYLAVGAEFQVHPAVRLGPQLGAALLLGNEICTRFNDEPEVCRDPETTDEGEKEGNLLAWRFMLVGSIMFGQR